MKALKALIEIDHPDASSTRYIGYPKSWIDNKERIPSVLIPQDRSDEVASGGKLYKIVYPVVPDDLAELLLKEPGITIANRAELQAYSDKHAPARTVTSDQAAVDAVLSKAALGETLTVGDKAVLDPVDPAPGRTTIKGWLDEHETAYGTLT